MTHEASLLGKRANDPRTDVPRYLANTIDDMQKRLLGYRDNMRVEIETGVAARDINQGRCLSLNFDRP